MCTERDIYIYRNKTESVLVQEVLSGGLVQKEQSLDRVERGLDRRLPLLAVGVESAGGRLQICPEVSYR
jgi:hypothetical protein